MMNEYVVEAFVGGRPYSFDVVFTNDEKGKLIRKTLNTIHKMKKLYKDYDEGEVTFLINGEEYEPASHAIDVKQVAKNMKTEWIENKIMDD